MNRLGSRQRKLAYLVGIIVLLIPIIGLGMPATREPGSGGQLARLRQQYELGETTLGEVDPSSATINLVLLGMRGVAASVLWLDADRQKDTKDWGKLRSTVNSIIMLQPHFMHVWRFQGWNLAYNISAEWDAVEDRFYWVKEGAKFTIEGSQRNRLYAELYWELGRFLGPKIGASDEAEFFRKFFVRDPDEEQFEGRPDPELNPEGKDNYFVSKDWFDEANRVEVDNGQRMFMRPIFRAYPARMLHEYARALQNEGLFNEKTRFAWESAFEEWTQKFGQEEFLAQRQSLLGVIKMESTYEDIRNLAEHNNMSIEEQYLLTDHYQKTLNYRGWRQRSLTEKDPLMVAAHRQIYEGKQLYREGKTNPRGERGELPSEAREKFETGLQDFEKVLDKYPELAVEDEIIEEVLLAIYYLRSIHQLNGRAMPTNFPLEDMANEHVNRMGDIDDLFRSENAAP